MRSNTASRAQHVPVSIRLRAPVLLMVVAATAIPIEIRPFGQVGLDFTFQFTDFLANVGGFVPVGIVLGGLGVRTAVFLSAVLSLFAETGQFAMAHRDPSVVDVLANTLGGIVGALITAGFRDLPLELRVTRRTALTSALLVVGIGAVAWANAGNPINPRGVTSPGELEARWRLDEQRGRVAHDSSRHHLNGRLSRSIVPTAHDSVSAMRLDGRNDSINVGHSSAFRIVGSMTISAWINSESFPPDDAAIVSSFGADGDTFVGYQLDTTADSGPRTIGFKIANGCGRLMARYGATPLTRGVWHHVAGVYNAQLRTMDVYLDGNLDNGVAVGTITGTQHSSRLDVYVGRRSDRKGFEFSGSVEDVRIYSRPQTPEQIAADMRDSGTGEAPMTQSAPAVAGRGLPPTDDDERTRRCAIASDREDAHVVPIAAAAVGVFAAVACVGFCTSAGWLWGLAAGLAAGLLILPVLSPTLPALNLWLVPLTSLGGAASVGMSAKHKLRKTSD